MVRGGSETIHIGQNGIPIVAGALGGVGNLLGGLNILCKLFYRAVDLGAVSGKGRGSLKLK